MGKIRAVPQAKITEAESYGLKPMVVAALLVKALVLLAMALGAFFLPFNAANYQANFVCPAGGQQIDFFTHFKTWDAQHYLCLADQGYHPGRISNAFYPLFPFLIRTFQPLFWGQPLAAGLALSNLFSILALVYLYRLVEMKYDGKTAFFSCVFLVCFPTAFYMSLVYTESLFLFLAAGYFYYSEKDETAKAASCAFFMALARPAGLLMAAPLAMALWTGKGRMGGSAAKKAAVPLLALAAGVVVYFLFMKFSTGRFMEGFAAQPLFGADHGVSQLIHPWDWFVSNFIRNSYSWSDYGTGVLDRIFFLLYALALVLSWKDFDKRWWVFALVLGLVPALSGRLVSFIRYGLVLFPLFVFASRRFKEKPAYLAVSSLLLQVILALAHSLNFWVA